MLLLQRGETRQDHPLLLIIIIDVLLTIIEALRWDELVEDDWNTSFRAIPQAHFGFPFRSWVVQAPILQTILRKLPAARLTTLYFPGAHSKRTVDPSSLPTVVQTLTNCAK